MIVEAESCDCSGGGVFCGGGVLQWSDTIFSSFSFPLLWLLIIDQVIGVYTACFLEVCSDAFFFLSQPSEKCGVLNVTKITEHGKKVR